MNMARYVCVRVCDYRWGMYWEIDIFGATYTHHSELQVITAANTN
jgi:hypothetical protein